MLGVWAVILITQSRSAASEDAVESRSDGRKAASSPVEVDEKEAPSEKV